MNEWNDEAVIVRMGKFREADVWIRMLCKNHGLQTVFAFGGLKSRRRFCGCLDLFNSLDCRVKICGKGSYLNLTEAVLMGGPRLLRMDWKKMGIAANCLRFLQMLTINSDSSQECFTLLENLRFYLEQYKKPSPQFPFYFRLRLAVALGFGPELSTCGRCGSALRQTALFIGEEGRIFCNECARLLSSSWQRRGHWLNSSSLDFLRQVKLTLPQDWHDETLTYNERKCCARAIAAFTQYHLESGSGRNGSATWQ